ncbi:porin [Aestuariivita boseongensis]|uniref:porin n=1 Tax=Aestuariivita boseongensis TaxID=1470562 RepID=UPI0006832747|nr:porin [Aestuariivita boseongensis]
MKKVLFLTTALIATGSMAAADVRISGYGRFGLDYNEANVGNETNITSRLRLQFDVSTETDGGVTLGARVRMQAENRDGLPGGLAGLIDPGGWADNGFNGARFYASFGGFQVGVGNILTAVEAMQGLYLETKSAGVGIDGSGFSSVVANLGGTAFSWGPFTSDGQGSNGVEVIYNGSNFGVHLSYLTTDYCLGGAAAAAGTAVNTAFGGAALAAGCTPGMDMTAISAYYTFGDWTAAIGYNDQSGVPAGMDNDLLVVTLQGDLGFAGVRLAYAEIDNIAASASGDASKIGLYGIFDIGAATSLIAFVTDEDAPGMASDGTGYGLHLSHDLGGGASIEAGVVESSSDNTTVQAGVFFSF